MNPRMLARLNILAAEQEAQLLETIRRHSAAIRQAGQQREVLSAYRTRLAGTWQDGAVLPAGQARRAGQFAAASQGAERQISATAERAQVQLDAALARLADLQSHRGALADAARRAAQLADRAAQAREERDLTWHRPVTSRSA
jgi:hypothetical protein